MWLDLSLTQYAFAAILFLVCGAIQSAVGFAFSLFVLPMLLMLDLSLQEAVTLAILGSTVQRLFSVHQLRASVDWRGLWRMALMLIASLPVGILLLRLLAAQPSMTVRQWIGGLVLAALVLWLLVRPTPRPRVAPIWGYLAACAGGVLCGLANIGGPPLVLWVHSHDWPNEKTRVTILALSLPLVPFQLVMLYGLFGTSILTTLAGGLILTPCVLAGGWLGLRLGKRVSPARLRQVAFALLTVIGLFNIARPFFAD